MPGSRTACLTALILGMSGAASANDGRDRYQREVPSVFYLFPDPDGPWAGYRVLPGDMPGGADGDRAYRWAQAHAVALVRVAAYDTFKEKGGARVPMAIFDLSAENGDTPVAFEAGRAPRGRHPGGSHDGGINLDLGYYLTSLKGKRYTPDHAACTEHFDPAGKDVYRCLGQPDRLDVVRQAHFLLRLFWYNRMHFDEDLIEEVGIDLEVQKAILEQLAKWRDEKGGAVYGAEIDAMERILTSRRWEGWARSHHHHLHLRLRNISPYGRHRVAIEKLLEKEREMDVRLPGARRSGHLRVRLLSYRLKRAVELEWLREEGSGSSVRFRVGAGPWIEQDPAITTRARAVLDLPAGPQREERRQKVVAEVRSSLGTMRRYQDEIVLPRQDPRLAIEVDANRLTPSLIREGDDWVATLRLPDLYRHLVTGVRYAVHRERAGAEAEVVEGDGPGFRASFPVSDTRGAIRLVQAQVEVSSRMTIGVPVAIVPR
jgi:hypothetical protein